MILFACRIDTEGFMGAPYSPDLRERVIAAIDGGLGAYPAAALFRVSVSYIYKALGRRRATGETTARPSGHGPEPKLAPFEQALRARVAEEPDITLSELQSWFLTEHAMKVSVGCLWKHLRRLGLTLKKSRSMPPNNSAPMSRRPAKTGAHGKRS
jgi:transposase